MANKNQKIVVDDELIGRLIDTVEDYLYDTMGDILYEKYGEDDSRAYIKGSDYDNLAEKFKIALGLEPQETALKAKGKGKTPGRHSSIHFLDRGMSIGGVRKFDVVTVNLTHSSDMLTLLADNLHTWTNEIIQDLGIESWDDRRVGVDLIDVEPSLKYYFPGGMDNEQILGIIKLLTEKFEENYE